MGVTRTVLKRSSVALPVCVGVAALALSGCTAKKPSEAHRLKALMSAKSKLVVLHLLPSQSMPLKAPPDEAPGQYGIRTVWRPGSVEVQPITARDVSNGSIERGGYIHIATPVWSVVSSSDPKGTEHSQSGEATLDLSELKDLDKALDYMESSKAGWSQAPPKVRTVVSYSSSDGFEATLAFRLDGDPQYMIQTRDATQVLDTEQEASLRRVLKGAIDAVTSDK